MAQVKVARKCRVWNRSDKDFVQQVMGDDVLIPAGKSITVGRRQAIAIKGHFAGKGVKTQIEVEPLFEMADEPEVYVDHRTGQIFPTRDALLAHLGVDPAAAEKAKAAPKFICPICEHICDDKTSYITHMEQCLKKNKTEKKS